MTTDADRVRPVIESMVTACRTMGLDVGQPLVLGVGANVVVHLAPLPIVARIATLTAEMRGGATDYLRRERGLTTALDERGVAVIAPTDLVDPGPHVVDGHAFLLLRHVDLQPVDLEATTDAVAAGRAFASLVLALAELPADLGAGDEGHPWAEMDTLLDTVDPTIDRAVRARLDEAIATLRRHEPLVEWQLVHGDAHRNNVAFADGRIVWFDFEDANLRPLAWDLATLRRAWPAAGDEACRRLGVDPFSDEMRWHHELREIYALLWNLLYAARDREFRPATARRLQRWLAGPSAGPTA